MCAVLKLQIDLISWTFELIFQFLPRKVFWFLFQIVKLRVTWKLLSWFWRKLYEIMCL